MSTIHTKSGIKNQYKLRDEDFLKTPAITSVYIGEQPSYYEAYLYLITDLQTNRKYLGIHKKDDKTYWTSATDKNLLKILQGSESRIEYKILEYGFLSVIQTKEHKLLLQHNAEYSDDWFNHSNGFTYKETVDYDKIWKLVHRIESGEFKSSAKENVKHLFEKLPTWQIRNEEYIPDLLKTIKDKLLEVAGNTDKCTPIVILEDRLDKSIYEETDLRIDGAHTLKAAYDVKSFEIHTSRIPKQIHKDFNNTELEVLASFLNRASEIVKEPNSKDTHASFIFDRYLKSKEEYNSDSNIQYLKGCNIIARDRKIILEKAKELIKKYDNEMLRNMVLIDYQEADKDVLNNKVSELENKKTLSMGMSSASLRWDRILEKLQDESKKKANVVIYHSSYTAAENWNDELKKIQKRLTFWAKPLGYDVEFTTLPYEREKIKLN